MSYYNNYVRYKELVLNYFSKLPVFIATTTAFLWRIMLHPKYFFFLNICFCITEFIAILFLRNLHNSHLVLGFIIFEFRVPGSVVGDMLSAINLISHRKNFTKLSRLYCKSATGILAFLWSSYLNITEY